MISIITIAVLFLGMSNIHSISVSSSSKIINMMIVVDTETLLDEYKNPSKDLNHPTTIRHENAYMIGSNRYVVKGQGTGDLEVQESIGSKIRWFGASEMFNSDNSIIIYNITHNGGDVMDKASLNYSQNPCVFPKRNDIRQIVNSTCNFAIVEAKVQGKGLVTYHVSFGLFIKLENEQGDREPALYGYFQWDPTIKIVN